MKAPSFVFACLLLVGTGCGPGTPMMMPGPDGGDASSMGGGDGGGGGSDASMGASCSTLTRPSNYTPAVQRTTCPAQMPGGNLTDGTYVVTGATLYVGTGGSANPQPTFRAIRLSGISGGSGTFERIEDSGINSVATSSGTVAIDAANGRITFTETCAEIGGMSLTNTLDGGVSTTYGYTVSASGALTLFTVASLPDFCDVFTYARQ